MIAFWWANKFLWILQVNKSMKSISYFGSNKHSWIKYNEFVAQSRLLLNILNTLLHFFHCFYSLHETKFQIDKWDFDALSNFKISLGVCYLKMEPICIVSSSLWVKLLYRKWFTFRFCSSDGVTDGFRKIRKFIWYWHRVYDNEAITW